MVDLGDLPILSANIHRTTIWSGAGVSVEGPSSLPTGWELTRRVFEAAFLPGLLETVLRYHRDVEWVDDRGEPRLPRLETVLGVAVDVVGSEAFRIIDDVRHAIPNRLHRFCAAHLAHGGLHITANFDTCIEQAAAEIGSDAEVYHFHGAIGPGEANAGLGATLAAIQGGFDPERKASVLASLRGRSVLVVGYSGSDFFDVDQTVAGLEADGLAGTSVSCGSRTPPPSEA